MALSQEQVAAIRAIIGDDMAAFLTSPAPVASAPVAPRIASPFATGTAASPASPAAEARRLFPQDVAAQRAHIAVSMAPRYTCTVETTATLGDGTEVPSALHGFTTPKESGIACPGIRGIAKGETCPGTIR